MKSNFRVICGVPIDQCTGANVATSSGIHCPKSHQTHSEAFACKRRYLMGLGYEQIGARAFRSPNGGPVEILTKRSRFGGKLRKGKERSRVMPSQRTGGMIF